MIDQLKSQHAVQRLCQQLNVAMSGYLAHSHGRPASERKEQDQRLLVYIRAAHVRGRGIYGPLKIQTELAAQGVMAGMTYILTREGWLYLAAVKDLYTCEIVGWSMDSRMTQTLVMDALTAAYWKKKPALGLMHHSDRGSQYCSAAYRALQARYGMQTSMSRKGNCWDNAPMESFFGTIKTESLHHYRFKTREHAKRVIFEYVEVFYNRIRRHAKIDNQIPADFASQYAISNQIAA